MQSPTMLIILDGFGHRSEKYGNAIAHAQMPFWQFLCNTYPSTLLKASGEDVGLPVGYIGNSEVGHMTLGAGRITPSTLKQFDDFISTKKLFSTKTLIDKICSLKTSGSALHLMGLLSDAGVHSHEKHLYAFLELAHACRLAHVFVHVFLDGRDTSPKSAQRYLERLEDACKKYGGSIASIHGRFYAMDRDNNWERTKRTYDLLCTLPGHFLAKSWRDVIAHAYHSKLSDEFVPPELLDPNGTIKQGDGVIFCNFRPDRAQQLSEAFINPNFSHFKNKHNTGNNSLKFFITPILYSDAFKQYNNNILFEKPILENTLLDVLATQAPSKSVYVIAETEKFAHVTYFFRGMQEKRLPNETYTLIPSIKTKDYVYHPEMSAPLITENLIKSLRTDPAYFYLVNYANPDMVGHSGNFSAIIKACKIIDQQLALLYHEVVERLGGTLWITADHGNAEEKFDAQGNTLTAHTANPVPFILVSQKKYPASQVRGLFNKKPELGLAHVAPTLLKHMKITPTSAMEKETIF